MWGMVVVCSTAMRAGVVGFSVVLQMVADCGQIETDDEKCYFLG